MGNCVFLKFSMYTKLRAGPAMKSIKASPQEYDELGFNPKDRLPVTTFPVLPLHRYQIPGAGETDCGELSFPGESEQRWGHGWKWWRDLGVLGSVSGNFFCITSLRNPIKFLWSMFMNLSFAFDFFLFKVGVTDLLLWRPWCVFFGRWCVSLERTRDTTAALALLNFLIMGTPRGIYTPMPHHDHHDPWTIN